MNKKQNNMFEQDEIESGIDEVRAFFGGEVENGIPFLKTENKSLQRKKEYNEDLLQFMGIYLSIEEKEEIKGPAPNFSKERSLEVERELDEEWFRGTIDNDIDEFEDEFEPDCFSWDDEEE